MGGTCYLTVSMCLCGGRLGRGGAGTFAVETIEELMGVCYVQYLVQGHAPPERVLGSRPCSPRKSKYKLTWDISPSQALTWQARLSISFSCLERGPTIQGRLGEKDVDWVKGWPWWILFLIVTAALGLMEPSETQVKPQEGGLSLKQMAKLMAWGHACSQNPPDMCVTN